MKRKYLKLGNMPDGSIDVLELRINEVSDKVESVCRVHVFESITFVSDMIPTTQFFLGFIDATKDEFKNALYRAMAIISEQNKE